MKLCIVAALVLATLIILSAFGLGYYCGSTSAPPTMLVEVEGGVE